VCGPPFYAVGNLVGGRVVARLPDVAAASTQRFVRVTIALLVMAVGCLIVVWTAQSLGVMD
jgi:hypothetical protein